MLSSVPLHNFALEAWGFVFARQGWRMIEELQLHTQQHECRAVGCMCQLNMFSLAISDICSVSVASA